MRSAALLVALAAFAGPAVAGTLRPFDAESWAAIRREYAGRPTLVHFWGMTCAPCRVEMPKLGAFAAAHPSLDVVTIDTDPAERRTGSATDLLEQSHLPLGTAWRFAGSFVEKLYFSVDPQWQGELPMTVFLSRDGTQTIKIGALAPGEAQTWLATQSP